MVSCCNAERWASNLKQHGKYYSGFVIELEEVLENHRISTVSWGTRTSIAYGKKKVNSNDKENDVDFQCQVDCKYIYVTTVLYIV